MLFGIRSITLKKLLLAGEFLFGTQDKGLKKNHESKYSQRCILGVEKEYLFEYTCKVSQKFTYFALTF